MRMILISAVAGMALAGCRADGTAGADGRLDVVASFGVVSHLAEQVGGDLVDVADLAPANVEPHDLELTSSQIERLEDADLVLLASGRFQPGVERAARRAGRRAEIFPTRSADPHAWLDPVQLEQGVTRVERALAAADPQNARAYRANGEEARAAVRVLHAAFADVLAPCRGKVMVVSHAAFGHLARRYGLRQEAIAGLEPESEPDPKRLAEVTDLVRREGVTTVFAEPGEPVGPARAVARETSARVGILDPVERLRPPDTISSVMTKNLETLGNALECR